MNRLARTPKSVWLAGFIVVAALMILSARSGAPQINPHHYGVMNRVMELSWYWLVRSWYIPATLLISCYLALPALASRRERQVTVR